MLLKLHLLIKGLGRGNPSARPMVTRIYGMLGCLVITCFFIGLMVFLEKTLPDGSKSKFHPTWRRDLYIWPRQDNVSNETVTAFSKSPAGDSYSEAFKTHSVTSYCCSDDRQRRKRSKNYSRSQLQPFTDTFGSAMYQYSSRLYDCRGSREAPSKIPTD